jgi:hypothetical protein
MFNKNKVFLFFAGVLFLSLFVVNFASAYRFGFVGSLDSAIYQAQPVLQFFFGGYDYTGYMMFERILIFILILSIVFVALRNAPFFKGDENRKVVVIVSVIVSLLSVRYIDYAWLNTIIMTYQVFGIAITSVLPFIIYLFFLHGISEGKTSIIRKIGWILFICVYLGLYVTADDSFYGDVYMWTMLMAFIFLLLDGTIGRALTMQKIKQAGMNNIWDAIVRLQKDRDEYIRNASGIPAEIRDKRIADFEKQLKKLYKMTS